jgi:hypothetical protein
VHYFKKENGIITNNPIHNTLTIGEALYDSINDRSSIAIFHQYPETNQRWTVRIIDLADNFKEQIYRLNHPIFKEKSLVQTIKELSNKKYIIALNDSGRVTFGKFDAK